MPNSDFTIKKEISRSAEVIDSNLQSKHIVIESGAKLRHVDIKAKKLLVRSNSNLTDCKIFSDGIIDIGNDVIIKEHTVINAFKSISIGPRTIIDRDVFVGGMQSEKSQIRVGSDCVILFRSYLNTTRKILIGNGVGIGGYCLIFTHSAWQNVLDGNPYKFADVKIKDNAWIPWNVTVLPGVIINQDVTVGSGSVITKSLPTSVFAAGVPAKVIQKKDDRRLSIDRKHAIALEILSDFREYALHYLKLKNVVIKNSYSFAISFQSKRLIYTLDFQSLKEDDVIISFRVPPKIKHRYDWIELDTLDAKTNENIGKHFIVFIRRYGIKIKKPSMSP
jgi:acetyltransferase-like isoleucine patch superfamily enzyme